MLTTLWGVNHFLYFSNKETLAQGFSDCPKALQQTSGVVGIWTFPPPLDSRVPAVYHPTVLHCLRKK